MSDEEVLDRMTLASELAYACEKLEDLSKLRTKSKVKDRRESFMNSVKNVSTWLKPPPQINKVVNQQLNEADLKEEKKIRRSQLLADKKHIPKRNKHTMAAIMDNYGYNDFKDIPNREVYEADYNWSPAPGTPPPSTSFPKDDGSGDADTYNADNTQDEDYLCDKLEKCKVSEYKELPLPPNTPADHLWNRNRGDVELDPNRSEQMFQEQYKRYAYFENMMNKMEGNKEFNLYEDEDEEQVQTSEPSFQHFQQNNYALTPQKQHVQNYGPTEPNEAFNWRNMHPRSNPSSPTPKYPYSSKSIRSMNKNRCANNNCPDDTYVNEPSNNGPVSDGYYMAIVKGRNGQNQYATTKVVESNNYYLQPQKEVKLVSRQSALTSILTGDDGKLLTGPLAVAMIKEHQKCSNKLFSSFRSGGEGRNSKSYLNSLSADVRNMNSRSVSQSHLEQNFKVVDALSSPSFSKPKHPVYGVGNVAGSPSKQEPIEFTVGVIKHRPIIKRSTAAPTKTINSPNKSNVVHEKGDQTNGKGVSVRKAEPKGNAASTSQLGSRKPFSSITGRKHTTGTALHMTPETKKYTTSARMKSTSKNNKTKPEKDMRVGNEKVNSLLAKMMSPETPPYSIASNETKITTKKLKIPNSTRL